MKIALCLFIKEEEKYLEEWLLHHKNIGIDNFILYDNGGKGSVGEFINKLCTKDFLIKRGEITVFNYPGNEIGIQCRAYEHCCSQINPQSGIEMIGFIDTDEAIQLGTDNAGNKFTTIQECLAYLKSLYGDFDGLGMSWRFYGNPTPPETRIGMTEYTKYHPNEHIKSIIKPTKLVSFGDPHKAILGPNTRYMDEAGYTIKAPLHLHRSRHIWVKHIWTRSREEFAEKMSRGRGDKCPATYGWPEFEQYNKNCIIND